MKALTRSAVAAAVIAARGVGTFNVSIAGDELQRGDKPFDIIGTWS